MAISIWYKQQGRDPEKVDSANTPKQAAYLVQEYRMAFGCLPGQHRAGKDQVWAGRKDAGAAP